MVVICVTGGSDPARNTAPLYYRYFSMPDAFCMAVAVVLYCISAVPLPLPPLPQFSMEDWLTTISVLFTVMV